VPEQVLKAEAVEKTFGSGRTAVKAVRGVDLELAAGERLLIMGPSGSGKTTLLSVLGGLLTPTTGRVLLGGDSLYDHDEKERADLRLQRLGFVFQSFNLLSALTAQENVEVPLRLAGVSAREAQDRAAHLLEDLGLGERADHRPRDLSGGEKQRVAIARALANQPKVVLADEPTANLDAETGRQVAQTLGELGAEKGKAVLIVSHDDRLRDVASRVVRVEDGCLRDADAGRE
jgi:putative ABC transport system ATP-binding protein